MTPERPASGRSHTSRSIWRNGDFVRLWAVGPAGIGIIAELRGLGSLVGAAAAGQVAGRLGLGRTMLLGLVGFTIGNALIPLAPSGAVVVGAALLIGQQLVGDSAGTVYDILEVSLTQSIAEGRVLGRVTATMGTFATLLQLAGTILGGVAALAFIWFSPIRSMLVVPVLSPAQALTTIDEGLAPGEAPMTERPRRRDRP